ncbi:MAG: ABC transporter permease [Candidatus Korobacteraceae bacterium]
MRNLMLIIGREYLVRVRTRAFLLFTVLMPLFIGGVVILPSKLLSRAPSVRHVAVVAVDPALGNAVRADLTAARFSGEEIGTEPAESGKTPRPQFEVSLQGAPSNELRQQLTAQLRQGRLDGVVWIDADAATSRKAVYYSRSANDFVATSLVSRALRMALGERQLGAHGFTPDQIKTLFSRITVDAVRVDKQGASASNGLGALLLPFVLMFAIYMTVLIYGIYVMRSVIEEKSSRVLEVLLGSVSPMQLMAGKIIGVGAVGLTQIVIWSASGVLLGSGGYAMLHGLLGSTMNDAHIAPAVLILFPVFFVLGYATYATLYAAIGAMVNSDEEAAQLQFPVTLPLLFCIALAASIISDPNTPLAFWLSMFPLTSPIIMFVRVSVSMPPTWQIVLSIALSLATLYGLVWVSARIYRVGILMYGKRPSLSEILKWLHYA